ncbi:hypothetical protein LCGC14_1171420 [marine sediment metagenome]|uniref:Uncharacterized protein n=1 Tax=marine sediment metagenome TaxID=412755 RepID=A0A0F9LPR1_9ZZZZ
MVQYNLTQIANATDYVGFIQNVNSGLMNGMLGIVFLVVVSVVLFLGLTTFNPDPKINFLATSFLAFIISLGLRALSLVPDLTMLITILFLAIALFMAYGSSK